MSPTRGMTPYRQVPARRSLCLVHLVGQDRQCLNTRARGCRTKLCVAEPSSCSRRGSPTVFLARKLSQLPQRSEQCRFRRDTRGTPLHTHPAGAAKLLVSLFWGKPVAARCTGRGASGSVNVEHLRPRLKCHVREKAGSVSSSCTAHGFLSPAGRRLGTSC